MNGSDLKLLLFPLIFSRSLKCHPLTVIRKQPSILSGYLELNSTDSRDPAVRTTGKQTAALGSESSYSITFLLIDRFHTRRTSSSRRGGRSQVLLFREGSAPYAQHGREIRHTLSLTAEFDFKKIEEKASIS